MLFSPWLPPASAVEVIESVPSVCVCVPVCPSVTYGLWVSIHHGKGTFGAKELYNTGHGGASTLRRFHCLLADTL